MSIYKQFVTAKHRHPSKNSRKYHDPCFLNHVKVSLWVQSHCLLFQQGASQDSIIEYSSCRCQVKVTSLPGGWSQTEVAWEQLSVNRERGFGTCDFIFRTVFLHKHKSLGCTFVHFCLCQRRRSADLAFCIRKVALRLAQVRPSRESWALWPSPSNQ